MGIMWLEMPWRKRLLIWYNIFLEYAQNVRDGNKNAGIFYTFS